MKLFLENELLDAIRENDEDLVESLLQRGANPNAGLSLGGECSLSLALRIGNERVLDHILQYEKGKFQYTNAQRVEKSESRRKTRLMLVEWCGFKVMDVLLKSAAERFTNLANLPTFQALFDPCLWYFSPTLTAWKTLLSCIEAWRKTSQADKIVDFRSAIYSLGIYKMVLPTRPFLYIQLLPSVTVAFWRLTTVILANTKFGRHRTHQAKAVEREAREYYFQLRKDLAPMRNSLLSPDAEMERVFFDSHVGNRELRNSGYRSPATLIFKAISESDNVTESMVSKLLSHDLLVCQPCNESSLAQVLLSMAIRRGWSNLAIFLVDRGTATARRVSGVCWPSISTGYAYSLAPRLWSYLPMTPKSGPQVHVPHDQYTEGSKIDFLGDLYKSQAFSEIVCELDERIYSTSTVAINEVIVIWSVLERFDTSGAQDPDLINMILSSMAAKGLRNPMFQKFLDLWSKTKRWSRRGPFESTLFHAVAHKNPHLEIVRDLLNAGFSPHWGTESQLYTPFQIALLENTDSRASQLLLDYGAVLDGSMYDESFLMKAVLQQRSFDKFVLLIKLGVSAEPKMLGRRNLYSQALSDLGLAEAPPPLMQNETEKSAMGSSQHRLLEDTKDEEACSASQSEAKSEGDEQSSGSTDNRLIRSKLSELGSPCFQVATYPKGWECHTGQTWEQVYGERRDRVQGAIHQYDDNDVTAVHYAAAVGDVDALKVLLFPGNLFNRTVNIWRLMEELFLSGRLPSNEKDADGNYLESACTPDSDGPPQPWLNIFEELPASTKDKIELPNITFSEWQLAGSESCLMPEKLSSKEKNRTPLHEAASWGRLEAIEFLLSYSGIDAKICDVDAIEKASSVKRLVLLSSVGAEFSEGVGELKTNHISEQVLRTTDIPEIIIIRCSYFMENWTMSVETLKGPKPFFFSTITPLDFKITMVAIRDIGEAMAAQLTRDWTPPNKPYIMELHGPEPYSPLDTQKAFSQALGRDVEIKAIEKEDLAEFYGKMFAPQIVNEWVEMSTCFLPGGIAEKDLSKLSGVDVIYGKTTLTEASTEATAELRK
ncbi:hypothetical protein FBULB1_392 [Fusarium bulbicola]|nr:hypothetical protein FBULB1_392 [Fusarium bulbicola]